MMSSLTTTASGADLSLGTDTLCFYCTSVVMYYRSILQERKLCTLKLYSGEIEIGLRFNTACPYFSAVVCH